MLQDRFPAHPRGPRGGLERPPAAGDREAAPARRLSSPGLDPGPPRRRVHDGADADGRHLHRRVHAADRRRIGSGAPCLRAPARRGPAVPPRRSADAGLPLVSAPTRRVRREDLDATWVSLPPRLNTGALKPAAAPGAPRNREDRAPSGSPPRDRSGPGALRGGIPDVPARRQLARRRPGCPGGLRGVRRSPA